MSTIANIQWRAEAFGRAGASSLTGRVSTIVNALCCHKHATLETEGQVINDNFKKGTLEKRALWEEEGSDSQNTTNGKTEPKDFRWYLCSKEPRNPTICAIFKPRSPPPPIEPRFQKSSGIPLVVQTRNNWSQIFISRTQWDLLFSLTQLSHSHPTTDLLCIFTPAGLSLAGLKHNFFHSINEDFGCIPFSWPWPPDPFSTTPWIYQLQRTSLSCYLSTLWYGESHQLEIPVWTLEVHLLEGLKFNL